MDSLGDDVCNTLHDPTHNWLIDTKVLGLWLVREEDFRVTLATLIHTRMSFWKLNLGCWMARIRSPKMASEVALHTQMLCTHCSFHMHITPADTGLQAVNIPCTTGSKQMARAKVLGLAELLIGWLPGLCPSTRTCGASGECWHCPLLGRTGQPSPGSVRLSRFFGYEQPSRHSRDFWAHWGTWTAPCLQELSRIDQSKPGSLPYALQKGWYGADEAKTQGASRFFKTDGKCTVAKSVECSLCQSPVWPTCSWGWLSCFFYYRLHTSIDIDKQYTMDLLSDWRRGQGWTGWMEFFKVLSFHLFHNFPFMAQMTETC